MYVRHLRRSGQKCLAMPVSTQPKILQRACPPPRLAVRMNAVIRVYKVQRPSKQRNTPPDSRAKLLACGRQIIERSGVRGLTVRGLATRARVNLGTFVYHFGTREAFVAEVLESWYAPIYARLQLTVDEDLPPLEKLRHFILRFAAFMIENRAFTRNVLLDLAGGEPAVKPFVLSLFGRHPQLLLRLIREAQGAGVLQQAEPLKLALSLVGATLMPILWAGILMPPGLVGPEARAAIDSIVLSPAEIEQRFERAMSGLHSRPAARRKRTTHRQASS
jgi:AcrR family transcriptional regulator